MKRVMIAALAAAQIATAAMAADLGDSGASAGQRHGAFAGARLRVPLGGAESGKARAGFGVAPHLQGLQADGRVSTRFGEGMELRFDSGKAPTLNFAGRPLNRLVPGNSVPDGNRTNISTLGWVAIGVGAAVVIVLAAGFTCQETNCLGSE